MKFLDKKIRILGIGFPILSVLFAAVFGCAALACAVSTLDETIPVVGTVVDSTTPPEVTLYNDLNCTTPFSGNLDFGQMELYGGNVTREVYFKATEVVPETVNAVADNQHPERATVQISIGVPDEGYAHRPCAINITLTPLGVGPISFPIHVYN